MWTLQTLEHSQQSNQAISEAQIKSWAKPENLHFEGEKI